VRAEDGFLHQNMGKNNEKEGNFTVDFAERNINDYWMVLSV